MTGSPVQRLMGRRTMTLLPTSEKLLEPRTKDPAIVKDKLEQYKTKEKFYYDRGSRPLPELTPDQAVRVRTPNGWKPAELKEKHDGTPRSYVIKAGDRAHEFRRNRRDLRQTQEPRHTIVPRPLPPPPRRNAPPMTLSPPRAPVIRREQPETPPIAMPEPRRPPDRATSRVSGRTYKLPERLRDYVLT